MPIPARGSPNTVVTPGGPCRGSPPSTCDVSDAVEEGPGVFGGTSVESGSGVRVRVPVAEVGLVVLVDVLTGVGVFVTGVAVFDSVVGVKVLSGVTVLEGVDDGVAVSSGVAVADAVGVGVLSHSRLGDFVLKLESTR